MEQKILRLPRVTRVGIFFLILFLSAFLADGRQSVSDFFWPLITIVTIPLWEWDVFGKRPKPVQNRYTEIPVLPVVGILLALCVSTVQSWSPGLSISSVIRIITGLVWVGRFIQLTQEERDTVVPIVGVFTIALALASTVFLWLPATANLFDQFTLITSPLGHMQSVYIVLPAVVLLLLFGKPTTLNRWAIIFGTIGILVSFSRMALGMAILVYIYALWRQKPHRAKALAVGLVSIIIMLVLIVWIPDSVSSLIRRLHISRVVPVYLKKQPVSSDDRLVFTRENMQGLKNAPLWGTGPGTFFLVSKQYAQSGNDVSAYSHDSILSLFTETGLIGGIVILASLAYAWWKFRLRPSAWLIPIGVLIGFGFTQSSFEHYPVWIFFAVLTGLLPIQPVIQTRSVGWLRITFLGLLTVYIISFFGSDVFTVNKDPYLAFIIAPYRVEKALDVIAQTAIDPRTLSFIRVFHPRSDDVALAMADRALTYNQWVPWIQKAMREYPSGTTVQQDYLVGLTTYQQPPTVLCQAVNHITGGDFPCTYISVADAYNAPSVVSNLTRWSGEAGPSKFLYMAGMYIYKQEHDPITAINFLLLAKNLAPNWGHFHIALAGMIASYNHDKQTAVPTLLNCLSDPYARTICALYMRDLNALPEPEALEPAILAIPRETNIP